MFLRPSKTLAQPTKRRLHRFVWYINGKVDKFPNFPYSQNLNSKTEKPLKIVSKLEIFFFSFFCVPCPLFSFAGVVWGVIRMRLEKTRFYDTPKLDPTPTTVKPSPSKPLFFFFFFHFCIFIQFVWKKIFFPSFSSLITIIMMKNSGKWKIHSSSRLIFFYTFQEHFSIIFL